MMVKTKLLITASLLLTYSISFAEKEPNSEDTDKAISKINKPLPIKAPMLAKEDATEVTVIVEKKRTIEEYRHRGELIMVKVIPHKGKAYFIDPLENRQQGSGKELMDAGVKPVHWVIKEF